MGIESLETVFQFQPDFAVVGVGKEHTFFGVEEVVPENHVNLVGGGPIGINPVRQSPDTR